MPRITFDQLRSLAPGMLDCYEEAFQAKSANSTLDKFGIGKTSLRVCHFFAQALSETGAFKTKIESLNYSPGRLMTIWPKRFPDLATAEQYAYNEQKLGEFVYGGRMGNDQPGDGFRYRGRGLLQITGRSAYRRYGKLLDIPLEDNPDLAFGAEQCLAIAAAEWQASGLGGKTCNELADEDNIHDLTIAINGGLTNLEDRKFWLRKTKAVWLVPGSVPALSSRALASLDGDEADSIAVQGMPISSEREAVSPPVMRLDARFVRRIPLVAPGAIDDEIKRRTEEHQAVIARLRVGRQQSLFASGAPRSKPLVLLAHGDSWFDYPLDGNGITIGTTDIIAQLTVLGDAPPVILNVSHYGDATTDELSLPKQSRLIGALQDSDNWLDGKGPDAILFSGGGNDIAGDQFCIFLNYAAPSVTGLNESRFEKALGMVEASFLDLFAFRDRYAPGVPIIGHSYDFPIPNGAHPVCAGPWLLPSLQYCNWSVQEGAKIVRAALTDLNVMLQRLEADARNNFVLVPTQGLLGPNDWANELHPYPAGFKRIANAFLKILATRFPGRVSASPAAVVAREDVVAKALIGAQRIKDVAIDNPGDRAEDANGDEMDRDAAINLTNFGAEQTAAALRFERGLEAVRPTACLDIDIGAVKSFLSACELAQPRVTYGLGAKIPFLGAQPGRDFQRVDCSGFVREAIRRATTPPANFPDGSVVQHDFVLRQGYAQATVPDGFLKDDVIRIAFLRPQDTASGIGHVVLLYNGKTIESHAGLGPDSRPWTGQGWQAEMSVFVLSRREPALVSPSDRPVLGAFDQGQHPRIACVNLATVALGVDWEAMIPALNEYANKVFSPIWGAPCELFDAGNGTVPPGCWALAFTDDADQADALGYHDLTPDGLPLSKVFVRTTIAAGDKVSVTASHEIAEMLIDPGIQLGAVGLDEKTWYAYETADAVEREEFEVQGIAMSNFVYPSWFEGFRTPNSTRFDHLGSCTKPFELRPGGYISVFKDGVWDQQFGSAAAERDFKLHNHPRAYKRRYSMNRLSRNPR